MGYGTDGLTFRTLRDANLQRLPLFKDAKGRTFRWPRRFHTPEAAMRAVDKAWPLVSIGREG